MDEVFNNVLVYLPIILIVLFRILGTRNRQTGKKRPAAAVPQKTAVPAAAPREKPPVRRPRKEPPRINKIPSPEAMFPETSLVPNAPAKAPVVMDQASREGFPENLNYLPVLKRAMVLTEIMGPPKALQRERDSF
ncbi:MAG: hypothetical protein LBC60_13805 [Spirochaetaceae bacterium]|jgi:hypothetical protein|nr:hypothetical protein [Spirochaetaceae bacterium]